MNNRILLTLATCLISAGIVAGDAENAMLFDAIAHNDVAGVQAAIEQHADINARGEHGNTPLHIAVLNPAGPERREIITLLVRYGAQVNLPNDAGQLSADIARTMPDFENIQELLGEGTCPFCLEEITPKDNFVRGSDAFGCDSRHIAHRTCLFDDAGHQLTSICPTCRATRDAQAARTEREALMFHHFVQQEIGGVPAAPIDLLPQNPDIAATVQALLTNPNIQPAIPNINADTALQLAIRSLNIAPQATHNQ